MSNAPASNRRTTLGDQAAPLLPFLEEKTLLRVRFHEVDTLRIVWHGHYVSYFEEARRAFGRKFGVDYAVFIEQNIGVPVVQLQLNFFAPARVSDVLEVKARLLKSESAKLTFWYEIRRERENLLLASGSTVQVFTTPAGELLLTWPAFMLERLRSWETLWQEPSKARA